MFLRFSLSKKNLSYIFKLNIGVTGSAYRIHLSFNAFLKTPQRRSCKIFSSFLWMRGPFSSRHSNSWVRSCNNSSSSSSLPPFSLGFSPVESTVYLFWPESDSLATKGSIFGWFWIEFWSKARSWVKFKFGKLLGVNGCRGVNRPDVHLLEHHLECSSNCYWSLHPTKDPDCLVLNCWSCFGCLNF